MQKKKVQLENAQLEIEVETKNRELTTNVMYLVQKNELLNNVTKKLINLKDKLADANKRPLHQIILNLQSQSDNEIWQEFEMRFNQVHKDFYDQIREKHPEITTSSWAFSSCTFFFCIRSSTTTKMAMSKMAESTMIRIV